MYRKYFLPVLSVLLLGAALLSACQPLAPEAAPTEISMSETSMPETTAPIATVIPASTDEPEVEMIPEITGPIAIINASLIDGTGAEVIPDAAILIEDGIITVVGAQADVDIPADFYVIDAQGGTILPGFIDAHTHPLVYTLGKPLENFLPSWLKKGLTTVSDVGSSFGASDDLAEMIGVLETYGNSFPGVIITGPMLTVPESAATSCCANQIIEINGADEARAVTARLISEGAMGIKVLIEYGVGLTDTSIDPISPSASLSPEELDAIVAVAHANEVWVMAHVSDVREAQMALDHGVDVIGHWPAISQPLSDEIIAQMIAQNTIIISTFNVSRPDAVDVRNFLDAGGILALGTDVRPGMPTDEIAAMLKAGMTPMEIIVAATMSAAQALGIEDQVGILKVGMQADVIVVNGDPLADMTVMTDVLVVIKGGELIVSP